MSRCTSTDKHYLKQIPCRDKHEIYFYRRVRTKGTRFMQIGRTTHTFRLCYVLMTEKCWLNVFFIQKPYRILIWSKFQKKCCNVDLNFLELGRCSFLKVFFKIKKIFKFKKNYGKSLRVLNFEMFFAKVYSSESWCLGRTY